MSNPKEEPLVKTQNASCGSLHLDGSPWPVIVKHPSVTPKKAFYEGLKEQSLLHVATYRLTDLRTSAADLGPDVFEAEITPALADTLSTRLSDTCDMHGWRLIDIHVLPDRVEALLMGKEQAGENGEIVAAALDGAVYGGAERAAAMN